VLWIALGRAGGFPTRYGFVTPREPAQEQGENAAMASKKIWLTWMQSVVDGSHTPPQCGSLLRQYGLEVAGHTWVDNLAQMAWLDVEAALCDSEHADLWLIASDKQGLATANNRYALSLITASVQAKRSPSFPIVCLGLDERPEAATLPTLLRHGPCLVVTDQSWPAKIVATAFNPPTLPPLDFRLRVHANPVLGQWFEIGPRTENWHGVMFGVSEGGTITHHAVGPQGQVPERTMLEYQIQGLQAQVGATTYTAWSVQNTIGPEDSYYIRVDGFPASLIVGGHPGTDQAEVFLLDLR
jgi:hypothetical protein